VIAPTIAYIKYPSPIIPKGIGKKISILIGFISIVAPIIEKIPAEAPTEIWFAGYIKEDKISPKKAPPKNRSRNFFDPISSSSVIPKAAEQSNLKLNALSLRAEKLNSAEPKNCQKANFQ